MSDVAADPGNLGDPGYLHGLRRDMLRFAELQLRDRHQAEDVVQEALAAALSQREQFRSHASLKTWVIGILKHKILDVFRLRTQRREIAIEDTSASQHDIHGHFDERGHWDDVTRPADWGDPHEALSSRQFLTVLEACLYRLPENPARVFMMREVLGLETREICGEMGITDNHCGVLLHRARLALRACLSERWFTAKEARA